MNLWLVILLGGLLTYGTRMSFILLLDRLKVPDIFRRSLRFIPATVLSAIILQGLVTYQDVLNISWRNPQLYAGALAVLVAWRTKNVLLTILAGMAVLLITQTFLGMIQLKSP